MMPRLALLVALLPLLSACGGLIDLGPDGPPATIYTLEPLPRAAAQEPGAPRIYVEEPQVSGALDSQRILVRRGGVSIETLADARWEARTSRLVQRQIATSLDNSAALEAIGEFNIDLPVDYRLRIDLRAFEAQVPEGGGPTDIEIAFVALLIDPTSSAVLASRHFSASGEVGGAGNAAIIARFNREMQALVGDLAAWIVATAAVPDRS